MNIYNENIVLKKLLEDYEGESNPNSSYSVA